MKLPGCPQIHKDENNVTQEEEDFTYTARGLLISRNSLVCGRIFTNVAFGNEIFCTLIISPSLMNKFCIIL